MKPRGPIAPRGPQVPPAPSARQRAWSALAPGPDPPFGLWGRSIPTGLTGHTVVVQLPHEPAARLPAPSSRATARRVELITITGIGDHLRPEWLITFTGIRSELAGPPMPREGTALRETDLRLRMGYRA